MRWSVLAGVALAAAALAGAIALGSATIAPPPGPEQPVQQGQRIRYPPDRPPLLTLPDGQRRAVLSVLNVARRMKYGDFVWNDGGVPAGEAWVRVDLAAQTLSLFRAGHEIGTAVILYGTDHKPTPTGVFPILQRAEHHRSTLYDAEMPFMLRLTPDGVAIHASNVRRGSATHGCIGVPEAFARRLFGEVRRGTIVVIEKS